MGISREACPWSVAEPKVGVEAGALRGRCEGGLPHRTESTRLLVQDMSDGV